MKSRLLLWACVAVSASPGCGLAPVSGAFTAGHAPVGAGAAVRGLGTLDVLTYNVAGLPALVSPSRPDVNSRRVSPHLNRYDIVLAQEDFSYHDDLVYAATHPFQSGPRPSSSALVGDGLTTLSNYPVNQERRQPWRQCSGYLFSLNDCLSEKGFSMVRLQLDEARSIHVYNLHADAGSDASDVIARADGFEQLADFMDANSNAAALIVGGDTNLDARDVRDQAILERFMRRTGLHDACAESGCTQLEIDRVFYRSSDSVRLHVERWQRDPAFVDHRGQALSDHPAVAVRFAWEPATTQKKLARVAKRASPTEPATVHMENFH